MKAASAPVTTTRQMNGIGAFWSSQIAIGNYLNACMLEKGYLVTPARNITNGNQYPKP